MSWQKQGRQKLPNEIRLPENAGNRGKHTVSGYFNTTVINDKTGSQSQRIKWKREQKKEGRLSTCNTVTLAKLYCYEHIFKQANSYTHMWAHTHMCTHTHTHTHTHACTQACTHAIANTHTHTHTHAHTSTRSPQSAPLTIKDRMAYLASMTVVGSLPDDSNTATAFSTSWIPGHTWQIHTNSCYTLLSQTLIKFVWSLFACMCMYFVYSCSLPSTNVIF